MSSSAEREWWLPLTMLVRDVPSELNTPAVVPVGGAAGEEVRPKASAGLSDAGLLFGRDAFFF